MGEECIDTAISSLCLIVVKHSQKTGGRQTDRQADRETTTKTDGQTDGRPKTPMGLSLLQSTREDALLHLEAQ